MPKGGSSAKRPDFQDVPAARRRNMAAIKGRDTRPELRVRRLLHRLGYRFRLHRRDLPGTPDIVLPGRHLVIFVHGCFWHRHGCNKSVLPQIRTEWWEGKLNRTVERDAQNIAALEELGWDVLVVWECTLGNEAALQSKFRVALGPPGLARFRECASGPT
ncbi:DNA mismatch endonuclease Vsr [Devosia sp. 1635]|uniref:very short patch repair endonuclease n=1 Tax=Devosia sp. 1635 TaxID=2726066 RepID=UPI0024A63843|nr:DNA mismatch endonuclease Vsr [Devosia sp. 1635]